jgi:hypothetical protein
LRVLKLREEIPSAKTPTYSVEPKTPFAFKLI